MTHWAETGCRESIERAVDNLRQLSVAREVPPEFQAVVSRMSERWVRLRLALDPCSGGRVSASLH